MDLRFPAARLEKKLKWKKIERFPTKPNLIFLPNIVQVAGLRENQNSEGTLQKSSLETVAICYYNLFSFFFSTTFLFQE